MAFKLLPATKENSASYQEKIFNYIKLASKYMTLDKEKEFNDRIEGMAEAEKIRQRNNKMGGVLTDIWAPHNRKVIELPCTVYGIEVPEEKTYSALLLTPFLVEMFEDLKLTSPLKVVKLMEDALGKQFEKKYFEYGDYCYELMGYSEEFNIHEKEKGKIRLKELVESVKSLNGTPLRHLARIETNVYLQCI